MLFISSAVVALGGLSLVAGSPVVQADAFDKEAICSTAAGYLASKGANGPVEKWCTAVLHIRPTTTTITSTYTQPLTQIYGIPVTSYESAAPPGTTTVALDAVSSNGTSTTTRRTTTYTFTNRFYTNTVASTKGIVCTRTAHAASLILEKACECLGATTPVKTSTAVVTTTGDVTTVTQTVTQVYGPTTTYPPTATVTAIRSTIYASTVTQTSTITSTNTFDQPAPTNKTETATSCSSTTTKILIP